MSQSDTEAAARAKQSREFAKRHKELVEREAAIDERETALDMGQSAIQLELRILEGKVAAKQDELVTLEAKLTKDTANRKEQLAKFDSRLQRAEIATEQAIQKKEATQDKLALVISQTDLTREALQKIERDVTGRQRYLKEQEDTIDKVLKDGNYAISSVNRELGEMEREKEKLVLEAYNKADEIKQLGNQVLAEQQRLEELTRRYEAAKEDYRADLADIKNQLATATKEYDATLERTDQRLLELKTREAELAIRQDVVQKQAEQVQGEKRQLDSKKALYGLM